MTMEYQITTEQLYHADIGSYTAYGITAILKSGSQEMEVAHISDVSLNYKRAYALVQLGRENQPAPVHLRAVVEDFIG